LNKKLLVIQLVLVLLLVPLLDQIKLWIPTGNDRQIVVVAIKNLITTKIIILAVAINNLIAIKIIILVVAINNLIVI
jgi:hypothetical protein